MSDVLLDTDVFSYLMRSGDQRATPHHPLLCWKAGGEHQEPDTEADTHCIGHFDRDIAPPFFLQHCQLFVNRVKPFLKQLKTIDLRVEPLDVVKEHQPDPRLLKLKFSKFAPRQR